MSHQGDLAMPAAGFRTFLTVWVGQLVSQVGTAMTGFAMSIYVYQQSGSVTRLAVVMLGANLPAILLAPVAGVMVDRFDRRRVMLLSDAAAGAGSLALALLLLSGNLEYWHIIGATVVGSAAGAFQEPAYRSALPTLVSKAQLGRANGLVEMAPAVGTLVAPAMAGAVLLLAGPGAVLAIDFGTFLVAVATLSFVRFPQVAQPTGGRRSIRAEALDGLRYLLDRRGLLGLLGIAAGLNFVFTLANVLWIPVFLAFTDEATLGTVMSGVGLSMVLGSVVMSAWGGPRHRVAGMLGMLAVSGAFLALAGLRPSLVTASIGAFGMMGIIPIVNGTSQALWQTKVAPAIQGRVFSTRRMVATIATPLSFALAGPLADGVFEPLLLEDGPLAGVLGPVFGTGPGRGSALLVTIGGLAVVMLSAFGWSMPFIRNLEREIPDAIPDTPAVVVPGTEDGAVEPA
jgi:MFS family permease